MPIVNGQPSTRHRSNTISQDQPSHSHFSNHPPDPESPLLPSAGRAGAGTDLTKLTSYSIPGYGDDPREKSSHMTTPKAQISDWVEKMDSWIDSMAIHFTGSRPCGGRRG